MSDYDRGAYTPQTDAPLAFDPRSGGSERRPMPMALIGSAIVLVLLLAGVAMVYRGGVRQAGESPRPVGAPVMAVKTAPPPQAATASVPAMDIYQPAPAAPAAASANTVGEGATLAPPPEQPAARPQPSAATVALLAKPAAPTQVVHPSTEVVEPARPAPAHAAAARAVAAKPVARRLDAAELAAAGATRTRPAASAETQTEAPAASAKVAVSQTRSTSTHSSSTHPAPTVAALRSASVASAPPAASADEVASARAAAPASVSKAAVATRSAGSEAAGSGAGAVVQIGAFSSTALADKGYADVAAAVPGRMGGKSKHVLALKRDTGTLYRTWVSGFPDRADATSFCAALKAKNLNCFVKGG